MVLTMGMNYCFSSTTLLLRLHATQSRMFAPTVREDHQWNSPTGDTTKQGLGLRHGRTKGDLHLRLLFNCFTTRLPPLDPAQMISISSNPYYSNEAVGHTYNMPAPEHPLLAIRLLISQLLCSDN